jgi:hypothetical protein
MEGVLGVLLVCTGKGVGGAVGWGIRALSAKVEVDGRAVQGSAGQCRACCQWAGGRVVDGRREPWGACCRWMSAGAGGALPAKRRGRAVGAHARAGTALGQEHCRMEPWRAWRGVLSVLKHVHRRC